MNGGSPPETVPFVEIERFFDGRATLFRVASHRDPRGILVPLEFSCMPFFPRRIFFVHDVPPGSSRGGHAHRTGDQFLIGISGEIVVDLHFEGEEHCIALADSTQGLLIGPRVWSRQTYVTSDAALCVLASQSYSENSYITESK